MKHVSLFFLPLALLLNIFTFSTSEKFDSSTEATNIEFVIVIPSYNNELWAAENLQSACNQKSSKPFQVICINDFSSDRTGTIMEEYVRNNNLESKVMIIHNTERLGSMANWYNTIHQYIPDHKVVVNLDGDDLLAHDNVLLTLETYYRDPDTWLTYGSAIAHPSGDYLPFMSQCIPDWVFSNNKIRDYIFVAQHLRTFKAGLFKKIAKADLMMNDKFVPAATDMAFMLPMLEMCAPKEGALSKNHSIFIPRILYKYRTDNPLNLFRTKSELQKQVDHFLRSKESYNPLDSLLSSKSN